MAPTRYATNDIRVTKPFVYGMCGLFICIGIALLFGKGFVMKFLAAAFIGMGAYSLVHEKKKLDALEQEQLKNRDEVERDGRF